MEQKKEIKKCECGCGKPTKIITHTSKKKGRIRGEYNRFICSHNLHPQKEKERIKRRSMKKRLCECKCGKIINTYDKWGIKKKYARGHYQKSQKGSFK